MLKTLLEKAKLNGEEQYLELIRDILQHGTMENGRNGYTKAVFGASMLFSLEDNNMPLLTTKRVAWKTPFSS